MADCSGRCNLVNRLWWFEELLTNKQLFGKAEYLKGNGKMACMIG